jgi:hypothetical protein
METKNIRSNVALLAIDPYVESNIVSPIEKEGKDYVEWGEGNAYPDYLLDLYSNVATLKSIIDGCVDYIAGDDVKIFQLRQLPEGVVNTKGDTILEQVKNISKDIELYGGFALQVIRGADGKPSEIYYVDLRHIRMNKECNVFYYCEEWNRRSSKKKVLIYPKFMPEVADK